MKYLNLLSALSFIMFLSAAQASDDIFALEDTVTVSSSAATMGPEHPKLVFCNEKSWMSQIPKGLLPLFDIPKLEFDLLAYEKILAFNGNVLQLNIHVVAMGEYKLVDKKDFHKIQFLMTERLMECVGVQILLPDVRAGLMHVSRLSFGDGKLDKFISFFPPKVRDRCVVKLLSNYYSSNLQLVFEKLVNAGFKIHSASISPRYGVWGGAEAKLKSHPYEKLGLKAEDMPALKALSLADPKTAYDTVVKRVLTSPEMLGDMRTLIFSVETGTCFHFMREISISNYLVGTKITELLASLNQQESATAIKRYCFIRSLTEFEKVIMARINKDRAELGLEPL